MTSRLLTFPFHDRLQVDDADTWAIFHERGLRELRYRLAVIPGLRDNMAEAEATLTEMVPARDAGDVCHVCGELVTWVDHLPPVRAGSPVRCRVNVRPIQMHVGSSQVIIDDIFPRV